MRWPKRIICPHLIGKRGEVEWERRAEEAERHLVQNAHPLVAFSSEGLGWKQVRMRWPKRIICRHMTGKVGRWSGRVELKRLRDTGCRMHVEQQRLC